MHSMHQYEGTGPRDCSMLCRDQPEVQKVYCTVKFVSVIQASKLVTIEVESWS